jgi:hypothetical protein
MCDLAPGQAEEEDEPEDPADADPDLQLFTDYLASPLSPRERARVDDRLENDPEFARWAVPLMQVWRMPLTLHPCERQMLYAIASSAKPADRPWVRQPVAWRGVLDRQAITRVIV